MDIRYGGFSHETALVQWSWRNGVGVAVVPARDACPRPSRKNLLRPSRWTCSSPARRATTPFAFPQSSSPPKARYSILQCRKHSRSDTGDIDMVLRRSFDGGRTWKALQVVADFGPDTVGNPCPVVDRTTGTIWLPLTKNLGNENEKLIRTGKSKGGRTVWITKSDDDGCTWQPVEITKDVSDPQWTWYATGPGWAFSCAAAACWFRAITGPRHSGHAFARDLQRRPRPNLEARRRTRRPHQRVSGRGACGRFAAAQHGAACTRRIAGRSPPARTAA